MVPQSPKLRMANATGAEVWTLEKWICHEQSGDSQRWRPPPEWAPLGRQERRSILAHAI